ncbi:MAG: hypothetical protein MRJ67_00790 [Nitrospirales bacterium]|nr:hypothetical protein [Nitrospirales bacterium]
MTREHPFWTRLVMIALAIVASGCADRTDAEVSGRAGRDVHDPSAQIVQDQFLIEYTLKNTSTGEIVFDRVEEVWSPVGVSQGLTQTVLPKTGRWRLPQGEARTFVSGTNGYTLQLSAAAKGRPIEFSVYFYQGEMVVLGPLVARLPKLRTLPRVDQHILSLKNTDTPLPPELADLPSQNMQRVSFSKKGD